MHDMPFWKQGLDCAQWVKELYEHPIREQLIRRPDMICQTCCHRWGTRPPYLGCATTVGGTRRGERLTQTGVGQHKIAVHLEQRHLISQARCALAERVDPASDRRDALANVEVEAVTVDGEIAPSTSASKPCVPLLRHTAPQ